MSKLEDRYDDLNNWFSDNPEISQLIEKKIRRYIRAREAMMIDEHEYDLLVASATKLETLREMLQREKIDQATRLAVRGLIQLLKLFV